MSDYDYDTCTNITRWTSDDACYLTQKAIYFDMDGTIADLYGVEDWLDKLLAHDPSPYYDAEPLVDPDVLWDFCSQASADGYRIGIVSWLSKECPNFYAKDIIDMKLAWCDDFLPALDEIVLAPYGTPKSTCVLVPDNAVLIDDELPNRLEWQSVQHNRIAYSTEDMMGTLAALNRQFQDEFFDESPSRTSGELWGIRSRFEQYR